MPLTGSPQVLELLRENPRQLNLNRCVLELYTLLEDRSEEERSFAIGQAMASCPGDAEIAFWAGCLYEGMGRTEEAEALFEQALQTSNGIILERLKEKGFPRLNTEDTEGAEHD